MPRPLIVVGGGDQADRVEEVLAKAGWDVVRVEADDVSGALGRHKPPVLLVELAPGTAGRTAAEALTQRMQATAYGAVVPVLFFGPAPGPNPAEIVGMGGDVFLPMPTSSEEVVACVKRLGADLLGAPPTPPRESTPPPATRAEEDASPAENEDEIPSPPAAVADSETPAPAPDDADHLRVLDDLPWAGMPQVGEVAPEPLPELEGADALASAMAGDAMLDPMALARELALAGQTSESIPGRLAPEPPATKAKTAQDPDPDLAPDPESLSLPDHPAVLEVSADEPSEIDAIVSRFVAPGGDSDTVAVRIKKTISAFEEQVSLPEEEAAQEAPTSSPGTPTSSLGTPASSPGTPASSPGTPASRPGTIASDPGPPAALDDVEPDRGPLDVLVGASSPGRSRPADHDDIDLDALDMDTIAGVDSADPHDVIDRLDEERSTPDPPRGGGITHVTATSTGSISHGGGSRVSVDLGASRPGVGSIPGPVTGSLPGGSSSVPEVPLPSAAEPSARPHRGTDDLEEPEGRAAPLASPYDLPPVVGSDDRPPDALEKGFRDVVDTVPGRRTAVIGDVKVRPLEDDDESELGPNADVTQPAQPKSKRKRDGRAPRPVPDQDAPEPSASRGEEPAREPPVEAPPGDEPSPAASPPPEIPASLRQGHLEDLDPARLFWEIGMLGLTGTLVVDLSDGRVHIVFVEGSPRFAHSSRPADRMLEMMQRRGQITATQSDEVVEEMTRSGRRAGAILLDRGWIKSAELIPTIRDHLADLLFAVFAAEEGAFHFSEDRPLQEEIVHLEKRPGAVVVEGVRRKYTPERIARLAGAADLTPVRRPDGDERHLAGTDLTGQDWRIIDAMDGRRTVRQLAEDLETPAHRVWSLAWALSCLGLISLPHADAHHAHQAHSGRDSGDADFDVDVKRLLSRHATAREGDYFACLGADRDATAHEIEEAYQRARSQIEPKGLHPRVQKRYATELAEVREVLDEAFDILSDARLRERYRRSLRGGAPRRESL